MLGKIRYGAYRDECKGIHPDTITKYYGVDGQVDRGPGETGAGHPPDEHVEGPLTETIKHHQRSNLKHEAVPVPGQANPFQNDPQAKQKSLSVVHQNWTFWSKIDSVSHEAMCAC